MPVGRVVNFYSVASFARLFRSYEHERGRESRWQAGGRGETEHDGLGMGTLVDWAEI